MKAVFDVRRSPGVAVLLRDSRRVFAGHGIYETEDPAVAAALRARPDVLEIDTATARDVAPRRRAKKEQAAEPVAEESKNEETP